MDRQLHVCCLELNGVIAALRHWVSVFQDHQVLIATDNTTVVSYIKNKKGPIDPFPNLVASSSGSLYVASSSGHSSQSQAHTTLFKLDSGPPIQTQLADIDIEWSLHYEVVNRIFKFWELHSGHVCHSPQYPPTSVHVSDSKTSSTGGGCSVSGLAGGVDVHVSAVPLLKKVTQKLGAIQEEVIPIAPW